MNVIARSRDEAVGEDGRRGNPERLVILNLIQDLKRFNRKTLFLDSELNSE